MLVFFDLARSGLAIKLWLSSSRSFRLEELIPIALGNNMNPYCPSQAIPGVGTHPHTPGHHESSPRAGAPHPKSSLFCNHDLFHKQKNTQRFLFTKRMSNERKTHKKFFELIKNAHIITSLCIMCVVSPNSHQKPRKSTIFNTGW